jgi:hypothetical protein
MPSHQVAGFLLVWKAENARRAQAVTEHQPVYGPVQYTEANYFTYLFAELTTNPQAALVKAKVITVTSAELHRFYLAHPGDFKESAGQSPQPPYRPQLSPFRS